LNTRVGKGGTIKFSVESMDDSPLDACEWA